MAIESRTTSDLADRQMEAGRASGCRRSGSSSGSRSAFERRTPMSMSMSMSMEQRETWLCRSTLGAASDGEDDDDLWSNSDQERYSDGEEEVEARDEQEQRHTAASARPLEDTSWRVAATKAAAGATPADAHATAEADAATATGAQPRKNRLTLGGHLHHVRGHALKKMMPVAPTPINIVPHPEDQSAITTKKKRRHQSSSSFTSADETTKTKKKTNKTSPDSDAHLAIYMDYEREEGFGVRRREMYQVRQLWGVQVALFLSTACVHCVSFNVSPGLRRLFCIEQLPVGLCIVVAWTLLGLMNCVGAFVGRGTDRIVLLRRLAWLWLAAFVVLQLAKVLPLSAWIANTFLVVGYLGAVVAHGILVPNVVALGAEAAATTAKAAFQLPHNVRSPQQQQQMLDAAMGAYFTRTFAAVLAASSFVQAFYFAAVDLELGANTGGGNGSAALALVIRSRRAVLVTTPCGVSLLALLIAFLFQSRNHGPPPPATPTTPTDACPTTTTDAKLPRDTLERKLAQGDLEWRATVATPAKMMRLELRSWLRIGRHSAALLALTFSTFVLFVGATISFIAQTVSSTASSGLVQLVVFLSLFVAWILTLLLSASQLAPSPRDKLYAHADDLVLLLLVPSRQQMFVAIALVCLASTAAFAAFLRAQLYSTMFVQTCQLRRPHGDGAFVFDPNVQGAWVGLVSVLFLPLVRFARRGATTQTGHIQPPRVSAVRCVAVGVLLYLLALFFSSIVELYRRDTKLSAHIVTNPIAAGCNKSQPSDFTVLWSVPHLVIFALADALFRVGAAEEAYALTAPLNWLGVAQGVLAVADCIGYVAALTLSTTLSPWLYRAHSSDLVLLLLLMAAMASLAYALTKRLADHIQASWRQRRWHQKEDDDDNDNDDDRRAIDSDLGLDLGSPRCRASQSERAIQDDSSHRLSRLRPSVQVLMIDKR